MTGPFATAAELAEFTGMSLPTDLARLQSLLASASAAIRRYCDQTLSTVTADVVTLESTDQNFLILPERPVTFITSVVVDGTPTTAYYFTRAGIIRSGSVSAPTDASWTRGAVVTYNHGYAETDKEFAAIRTVCIQAATRAFTLNERSASEAMGSTLMESAGYAPEVFLTQGEKWALRDFAPVGVG